MAGNKSKINWVGIEELGDPIPLPSLSAISVTMANSERRGSRVAGFVGGLRCHAELLLFDSCRDGYLLDAIGGFVSAGHPVHQ